MIYISHGTVPRWSSQRISHALFLPEAKIARHLRWRRVKYVPLAQALRGQGDALTIDDGSHGALRLALMARHYNHAVSWFVNGRNVEDRTHYYPFQISSMLDNAQATTCEFERVIWNLQTDAGRRALRLRIKAAYMRLRSHGAIEELIEVLARSLEVDATRMEHSLTTVGPAELCQAAMAGIDLQNHSWSHLNPQVLSEGERTAEAVKNEEYLSQFRKATTRVFAPPFGQEVSLSSVPAHFVLLANRKLVSDHRHGNLANRCDLLLADSAGNYHDHATPRAKSVIAA